MQKVFLYAFCCHIFQVVISQVPNTISNLALSPPQPNLDDLSQKLETSPATNKFTCVLNLLKSALSEEIENSQCHILEEPTQESVLTTLNSLIQEEQAKKEDETEIQCAIANETDAEKALYRKVITKIASTLTKPKNNTDNQIKEMPNMIPIFKPRMLPGKDLNQNIVDCKPAPRSNQNPRPIAFVPEKIVQTNMNLIPNQPMFNIPCQRAADVLDMTNVAIPKKFCGNIDLTLDSPNVNPIVQAPEASLANQIPAPITLSVNCADMEDTVAMLFKPKAISLMQLYGNLLKKITITVLVPYHMSKLAAK